MAERPRLLLIDANNQMYRAYHAMRGAGLSGPGGKTTHAVYIFVTMLRKLIQDHKPEYIAASFDLAGPTFRSEMATDYRSEERRVGEECRITQLRRPYKHTKTNSDHDIGRVTRT